MKTADVRLKDQENLLAWFRANRRPLPWRADRDPYRIWISEAMLQQTTVTTVIPYFSKFMSLFPNLKTLARAEEPEVLAAWAGLGYYSRARNLLRAARELCAREEFPRTFAELIELPGFGPYTARAVSSLAFGERAGVLDGNVIRVLCRFHGLSWRWWETRPRRELQRLADQWVQTLPPEEMNQALMELGATICTPKAVACISCPLFANCKARKSRQVMDLPLARPRRAREIWRWSAELLSHKGRVALVQNFDTLPFLKGQWVLPGRAEKLTKRPASFDYQHSITHHDIFVTVRRSRTKLNQVALRKYHWVDPAEIHLHTPASLVRKALEVK